MLDITRVRKRETMSRSTLIFHEFRVGDEVKFKSGITATIIGIHCSVKMSSGTYIENIIYELRYKNGSIGNIEGKFLLQSIEK